MVASASAPSRLTAIQKRRRKIFGMGPWSGGECPVTSIVAKRSWVRKRRCLACSYLASCRASLGWTAEGGCRHARDPNQRDNLIHSGSQNMRVVRSEYPQGANTYSTQE